MTSILNDTKHSLGLLPDETAFDQDIIITINSAFMVLTQLGVGPPEGYRITSAANEWDEFYTDPRLDGVRTYLHLKSKLVFDPPGTGFVLSSMERQIQELEYRLNVVAEYG